MSRAPTPSPRAAGQHRDPADVRRTVRRARAPAGVPCPARRRRRRSPARAPSTGRRRARPSRRSASTPCSSTNTAIRIAVIAARCSGVSHPDDAHAHAYPSCSTASDRREVLRVLAGQLEPLARARVVEPEPHGVQPLPRQPDARRQRRVRAVREVADAGVPRRREVHADLVRPAGLQVHLDQRGRGQHLEHLVVRDRRLAVRDDRELPVRARVPADRGVDGARRRLRVALHERVVDLLDRALLERPLEHACTRARVLATTISPDVPASSRCTMPCRSAAPDVEIR